MLARIARILAFLMAALVVIEAVFGPIVILPMALVPLLAGIGITRRRVWSAWGFALYILAQLAILPVILLRSRNSDAVLGAIAVSAFFSLAVGILFLFAGRAMKAAGATPGHALPWIAVSALVTVPLLFVEAFVIPTGAMEDTLLVGDRILVQRFPGPRPEFGEIMALIYPIDRKQTFIKRIVGLPGDRIRVTNKELYRNGVRLNEPYAVHKLDYIDAYRDNFPNEPNTPLYPPAQEMLAKNVVNGEVVVPPGNYFVMGDNRDQSLDSRYWGFVSEGDFIGRPLIIYDSADQPTALHISHTRWNRLFKLL
jgi:signal peptidase I